MVALRAELYSADSPMDRRSANRRTLKLRAQASAPLGPTNALVLDLSQTGMLIETVADIAVGEVIEVDLPEAGVSPATVVWVRGRRFGCSFQSPLSRAAVSAALLLSPVAYPLPTEVQVPLSLEERASAIEQAKSARTAPSQVTVYVSLAALTLAVVLFLIVLLTSPSIS